MFLKAQSKRDIFIHLGIMVLISLSLILLFFYVYLPLSTKHGEVIPVPDLSKMKVEEVEKVLAEKGLRYQISDSSYIPDAVPFTVINQHPLPGAEVKSNRKIYITVTAKNPPMVPMPDLKDKSLKAAEMELKSRDLVLGEVRMVPSPFPNLVMKQLMNDKEIVAGTHIPKGTKIVLEVGNGEETKIIELPNLVGKNIDDAKAEIADLGLLEGLVKKEQVEGKESGTVLKQDPAYKLGATIKTGETINLWYAE